MRTGAKARILGGALGVGAVRVLIVVSPLILLPILLPKWGFALFGAWITANAIAGFLSAVSISMLPVLTADTALQVGAGDMAGAARSFRTLSVASAAASVAVCGLAAALYWWLARNGHYDLAPLDIATVLLLFQATAIAALANIYAYGLGAIGGLAIGNGVEAARRGAELAFTIIAVAFFGASPFTIAVLMVGAAVISLFWCRVLFWWRVPWSSAAGRMDGEVVRRVSGNMSGSVLLALAQNQIMVVAPRVLIENILGSREVVQFATITALTRGVRQLTDIVVYPFQPEFSFAFGCGDLVRARRLFLLSSRFALWLPAAALVGVVAIGPDFIRLLTGGELIVGRTLIVILACAVLVESALLPSTIWLIATGRVLSYAVAVLVSGTVSLAAAAALAPVWGSFPFGYALLVTACCAGGGGTYVALAMLKVRVRELLVSVAKPPLGELAALLHRRAK